MKKHQKRECMREKTQLPNTRNTGIEKRPSKVGDNWSVKAINPAGHRFIDVGFDGSIGIT